MKKFLTTYENRIPMRFWAEDDLPSQKLLIKGRNSLSDAEILSVIIGSGIKDNNSLEISKNILQTCDNNLSNVWKLSVSDLTKFRGIGVKKAIFLVSVFELSRRKGICEASIKQSIKTSRHAFELLSPLVSDVPYEEFWIILMNKGNKVLGKAKISEGGVSGTVVDPKKIFKIALDHSASSIILCHNHPSGVTTPSEADARITKKVKDAGLFLEIAVLDHIIIGGDQYFSFADDGVL